MYRQASPVQNTADENARLSSQTLLAHHTERKVRLWERAIAFLICLAILRLVQSVSGAPQATFGAFGDEVAHFMGGLLVRDYLMHPFQNPLWFARDYYVHFPYFAVGVWPPFFYLLEGCWTLLFGVQRTSVLWLVASSGAVLATLFYSTLKPRFGILAACIGTLILLSVRVVQWSSCLVLVDLTCTLFAFAAILFFVRFVDRQRWQDAAWMGVFYGIALLTKNSTYFTLMVPPIVILATGRWDLLCRPALWAGAAITTALYLPWLLISRPVLMIGTHGYNMPGFLDYQWDYLSELWSEMSFMVLLAAAGLVFVVRSKGKKMDALSWSMIALLVATPIGLFAARVLAQPRYLILPYAAVIFFMAEFWSAVTGPSKRSLMALGTLVLFSTLGWMDFQQPHFREAPPDNIRPAVAFIEARDRNLPGSVLAPSTLEGPWIAEFAENEAVRPRRIVVRPTKFLGQEDWNGSEWHPYYNSAQEIDELLQRIPVKYCVLAESRGDRKYPHDQILESLVAANPDKWRLVFRDNDRENPFRIYENSRWTPLAEPSVYREVRNKLLSTIGAVR